MWGHSIQKNIYRRQTRRDEQRIEAKHSLVSYNSEFIRFHRHAEDEVRTRGSGRISRFTTVKIIPQHSTGFPPEELFFTTRESRFLQEPRRNTLCGRGLVLVGGATHVGGVYGGGSVLPLWKDSLISLHKHRQMWASQTRSDLWISSWWRFKKKILCFSSFC